MTVNDEMKIPYVSKEICSYLRDAYKLQNVCYMSHENDSRAIGFMQGIDEVISRLEAIVAQQEENNGIY